MAFFTALGLALAPAGSRAAEAPASLAAPATGEPVPSPVAEEITEPEEERFEDWRLAYTEAGCAITTAVQSAGGREVLRLGVFAAPELAAGQALAMETALPLLVAEPVALTIGPGAERLASWRVCGPEGCVARVEFDPELLGELRRERMATVAFTLADGVRVRLQPSLMGFSAAERALAER